MKLTSAAATIAVQNTPLGVFHIEESQPNSVYFTGSWEGLPCKVWLVLNDNPRSRILVTFVDVVINPTHHSEHLSVGWDSLQERIANQIKDFLNNKNFRDHQQLRGYLLSLEGLSV